MLLKTFVLFLTDVEVFHGPVELHRNNFTFDKILSGRKSLLQWLINGHLLLTRGYYVSHKNIMYNLSVFLLKAFTCTPVPLQELLRTAAATVVYQIYYLLPHIHSNIAKHPGREYYYVVLLSVYFLGNCNSESREVIHVKLPASHLEN